MAPTGTPAGSAVPEQKLRLIVAMIDSVGEQGYRATTVADVVARSGVSRKTFYKHFRNKRECFLAAYDLISAVAIRRVKRAYERANSWPTRVLAAMEALCEAAIQYPSALRLSTVEIGAIGPEGIERRERDIDIYERFISDMSAHAPGKGTVSRTVARAVVGGINRALYSYVSSGEDAALLDLSTDLVRWATVYYPTPPDFISKARADTSRADSSVLGGRAPGTLAPHARLTRRRGLPRGDQNVSRRFVTYSQCERILDAVTNLSAAHGYAGLNVNGIADEAAVSLNAFYEHFTDKEEAFLAAYELGHTKCLAIVERAFNTEPEWHNGVRAGISALLHFLAAEPTFAHIALVDAVTATTSTTARSSAGTMAYARMLLPGLEKMPENARPPAVTIEAVVGGVLEICLHCTLQGRIQELPQLTGDATYVVLAPFIGAKSAARTASTAYRTPALGDK